MRRSLGSLFQRMYQETRMPFSMKGACGMALDGQRTCLGLGEGHGRVKIRVSRLLESRGPVGMRFRMAAVPWLLQMPAMRQ